MSQDTLVQWIGELADRVMADPRWREQGDELGVSILGMLLYGFALSAGRAAMLLDSEEIDGAVLRVMTERIGAAAKWSGGLIAEARRSALDSAYHAGNYELIGVGHSYFGEADRAAITDNVFANIQSFRRRLGDAPT